MWAAILLALATAASSPDSTKRLAEVRGLMATRGPRQTLSSLFAQDDRWDLLLDDIATGKTDWLSVAAELRAVSDAHASETLAMAIQEALPRNPTGVLDLIATQRLEIAVACSGYGFGQIEDERPISEILGLVDKRVQAVSRVRRTSLAAARDGCLTELKSLRTSLQTPVSD
jgi:hypothetical protein